MIDPGNIHHVYFLGLGGIGMSAIARYFLHAGVKVSGYDRTETSLTRMLEAEGMKIVYSEEASRVPDDVDLVVFTPAVPASHPAFVLFRERTIPMVKRAEVLGMIASGYQTVAIAGTHGKTTTTTLAAHLLRQSHIRSLAFLGGISKNYEGNFLFQENPEYLVAEADEYDRSFLHLHPRVAVITSMDADHLDIYGSLEELHRSFSDFAGQILEGGALVIRRGLKIPSPLNPGVTAYTYSTDGQGDFSCENLRLEEGLYHFDFRHPGGVIRSMVLGLPGLFNVENAVAALAAAHICGAAGEELRSGLLSFQGVRRRFDLRVRTGKVVYIDDYAHHPEELAACIGSVKKLYPGRKVTGIFQPHLYTRTRDFAEGFAHSLAMLDELILLPIYPARELPIKGITSEWLLEKVNLVKKRLLKKNDFPACLGQISPGILLTMGAGDIDTLVQLIEEYVRTHYGSQP